MRTPGIAVFIVALTGSAIAQPGLSRSLPPTDRHAQPGPVVLTVDEQYLVKRGYIGDGAHFGGGFAAVVLGFGAGQAIQSRWLDRGWIFTLGEGVSMFASIYGGVHWTECLGDGGCHSEGSQPSLYRRSMYPLMIGGLLGLCAFRLWGSIDAFVVPASHNRRLGALHRRLGTSMRIDTHVTPYVAPPRDGDGAVGGLTLRF